jgi:hypothetical protein
MYFIDAIISLVQDPLAQISQQGIRFVQQVAAQRSGQENVTSSIVHTVGGLLSYPRKPGNPAGWQHFK